MTQPFPPAGGTQPPPVTPLSDAETRQWAGLVHLGGIIGPVPSLVIWLLYKDRSAFVADQARAALNFQITAVLAWFVAAVLSNVVPFVGWLFPVAVWVVMVVLSIQGFQAVNRGQAYRYPFSLELVK